MANKLNFLILFEKVYDRAYVKAYLIKIEFKVKVLMNNLYFFLQINFASQK